MKFSFIHLIRFRVDNSMVFQWVSMNLSNTVVLLAFLLGETHLAFLDVIFFNIIFFNKVIQKSDCYWALAQVCTAPMLPNKKIS